MVTDSFPMICANIVCVLIEINQNLVDCKPFLLPKVLFQMTLKLSEENQPCETSRIKNQNTIELIKGVPGATSAT